MTIGDNQLSGEIPPELADLPRLSTLRLHGNHLTGEIPPGLGYLRLRELRLDDNELSGPIPATIGSSPDSWILQELRLHGNHLSGPIPESLGGLPNLRVLSLHNNQLTGQIPKELAELGFLTELTLNDNSLTGEIPYTLGQAQDLEVVHVRGNRLSGCVPSSIEDVVEDYGEDRLIPLQQFELPMCSDLSLTDVLGSVHADNVEALYRDGVFKRTECGPRQFCHEEPVKRWEAAVWLVRVLDGKDPSDAGSAGWVGRVLWNVVGSACRASRRSRR